jgi:hypothetical protein
MQCKPAKSHPILSLDLTSLMEMVFILLIIAEVFLELDKIGTNYFIKIATFCRFAIAILAFFAYLAAK